MKVCPIQEVCMKFDSGSNKPPNNDVRNKIPCKSFMDYSCELSVRIQQEALGLAPACKLKRRVK